MTTSTNTKMDEIYMYRKIYNFFFCVCGNGALSESPPTHIVLHTQEMQWSCRRCFLHIHPAPLFFFFSFFSRCLRGRGNYTTGGRRRRGDTRMEKRGRLRHPQQCRERGSSGRGEGRGSNRTGNKSWGP